MENVTEYRRTTSRNTEEESVKRERSRDKLLVRRVVPESAIVSSFEVGYANVYVNTRVTRLWSLTEWVIRCIEYARNCVRARAHLVKAMCKDAAHRRRMRAGTHLSSFPSERALSDPTRFIASKPCRFAVTCIFRVISPSSSGIFRGSGISASASSEQHVLYERARGIESRRLNSPVVGRIKWIVQGVAIDAISFYGFH